MTRRSNSIVTGELTALLEEDSDGQLLAEYLLKKKGLTTKPRSIYANCKLKPSQRDSIEVILEPIESSSNTKQQKEVVEQKLTPSKTPLNGEHHVPQRVLGDKCPDLVQNTPNCLSQSRGRFGTDSKGHQRQNETKAEAQRQEKVFLEHRSVPVPSPVIETSPFTQLSHMRRSGYIPSADRIRRFAIKRRSNISERRSLLKEFENTATDSNFVPPIFSTPFPSSTNLPEIKSPLCDRVVFPSPLRQEQNTKQTFPSLQNHNEAICDMMAVCVETTSFDEQKQVPLEQNILSNVTEIDPIPAKSTSYEKPTDIQEAVYLRNNTSIETECEKADPEKQKTKQSRIPRLTLGRFKSKINELDVEPTTSESLAERPEIVEPGPEDISDLEDVAGATERPEIVEPGPEDISDLEDVGGATQGDLRTLEKSQEAAAFGLQIEQSVNQNCQNIQTVNEKSLNICDEDVLHCTYTLPNAEDASNERPDLPERNSTANIYTGTGFPLNLAGGNADDCAPGSPRCSRRKRKSQLNRTTTQQTFTPSHFAKRNIEVGPPRAHALVVKRADARQRRKIPLNAAPRTPINGEPFAGELKSHLARLNNREILDLRKRNSLGTAFPLALGKDFRNTRAAQQMLENEIEFEMQKRNLVTCDENLALPEFSAEQEEEQPQKGDADNWLSEIPPAPEGFRDASSQNVAEPPQEQVQPEPRFLRSFTKDVSGIASKSMANCSRQSSVRSKKNVLEDMQNYLEIQNQLRQNKSQVRTAKRRLYSLAVEQSRADLEGGETNSEGAATGTQYVLVASDERTENTPQSAAGSSTEEVHTNEVASSVVGLSVVNESDVFKKPEVPKKKSFLDDSDIFKKPEVPKKISKRKASSRNKASIAVPAVEDLEKTKATSNEDTCATDDTSESTSLRRSKRGHKPLKNYWSFHSTDPTPLYDIGLFYRKREEDKRRRQMKYSSLKLSMGSEEPTLPTATSTVIKQKITKNGTNKKTRTRLTKDKKRQLVESVSGNVSAVSVGKVPNGLSVITEAESQEGGMMQSQQKEPLNDNRINQLEEVDIIASQTPDIQPAVGKRKKKKTANTKKASKSCNAENSSAEKPREKKTSADTSKVAQKTQSAVKEKQMELQIWNDVGDQQSAEPLCDIAVSSTNAAHINHIFDELKNDKANEVVNKKELKVRLVRLKNIPPVKSGTVTVRNASVEVNYKQITKGNSSDTVDYMSSTPAAMDANTNTELPSWLKDVSHVGSKIMRNTEKDKKIFEEMHCSIPGNLVLTQVDGLDYAYYENDKEVPFGYIRFKPKQVKRVKTARSFHLTFFVLSGTFKICTNKDQADFSEGAVITIHIGSRYSIENLSDKMAVLMVFKKK